MDETDRWADWVNQINGTAIRDVNAEANSSPISYKAVAALKATVCRYCRIDVRHISAVNLLRRDERHHSEAMRITDLAVQAIQPRQCFRLVVRHLDAGHAQRETVNDARQRS
jgi:hypothetical protein